MRELEQLRAVFLDPALDEETRKENEEQIRAWEQTILQNEAFANWRDHDISKAIVKIAKDAYVEASLALATNRSFTDAQRYSYWAKQDAARWLLSVTDRDAKGTLDAIQREIRTALSKV